MPLSGKYAGPLAQTVLKVMKPRAVRIDIITLDNGLEFAEHTRIAKELNAAIYFDQEKSIAERIIFRTAS